jgi:succinyl-CoA synthetase beta subunit
VIAAFKIILGDPNVKGIFVNIFGGIMDCNVIATGIVEAVKEVGLKLPLVVRLEGNNVAAGKADPRPSGLTIVSGDTMADAAQKIVKDFPPCRMFTAITSPTATASHVPPAQSLTPFMAILITA